MEEENEKLQKEYDSLRENLDSNTHQMDELKAQITRMKKSQSRQAETEKQDLSVNSIITQIHLEIHLVKKRVKESSQLQATPSESSWYSTVAEDFQRAQDALKHAQNALKKSANVSTSKVMSDGEWNAEKKGIADHVNTQESLENSSQVKRMTDEIQQHADVAIRYRSMYMQLLDKLEECGVFVHVDNEECEDFSHELPASSNNVNIKQNFFVYLLVLSFSLSLFMCVCVMAGKELRELAPVF